jgi:hypothetical protein
MQKQAFVMGMVGYLDAEVQNPYNYMYDPPPGVARENCRYAYQSVAIYDGRLDDVQYSVHRQGFELMDAPTSVASFHDNDQVEKLYYAEVREMALTATGARYAYVFDHLVRKREAGRPPLTFGRHGDGSNPAAVGRVHNDYSDKSGMRRLSLVADAQNRHAGKRFGVVNIWRSIAGPIVDTPLAVCDARSVLGDDLVAAEIRYQTRSGEIYLSKYNPLHRWVYFSEMNRNEALVFKQFDSDASVARYTLHSAFDLPDIPLDAPLRESIEARCLVVYD